MLGVAGAAAIADDQKLVAGAQRRNDRGRNGARGGQQRRIAIGALERGERCFRWAAIRSFEFWFKMHRQGSAGLAILVLIAPLTRKLTKR